MRFLVLFLFFYFIFNINGFADLNYTGYIYSMEGNIYSVKVNNNFYIRIYTKKRFFIGEKVKVFYSGGTYKIKSITAHKRGILWIYTNKSIVMSNGRVYKNLIYKENNSVKRGMRVLFGVLNNKDIIFIFKE